MNMHARIMRLQHAPSPNQSATHYKEGHRDARHAAAEIASEGDALIADLLAALEACPYGQDNVPKWMEWNNSRKALIARAKGEA